MNFSQPFTKQIFFCVVVSNLSNPLRKIYQSLDRNVEVLFLRIIILFFSSFLSIKEWGVLTNPCRQEEAAAYDILQQLHSSFH